MEGADDVEMEYSRNMDIEGGVWGSRRSYDMSNMVVLTGV
jgi:hypothetical protein